MSSFIVRFIHDPGDRYRGRVRHVSSGEEAIFFSTSELLSFFDAMNATSSLEAETRTSYSDETSPIVRNADKRAEGDEP